MANSQPTVSEIRTAKRQAVGGGRKRCRRGKNCSAACIQAGMACLVEMPESAGMSLSKVSGFLSNRAPSVPSGMKRELAALGSPESNRSPSESQIKSDVIRVFRSEQPRVLDRSKAVGLIVDDIERVKMGADPLYLPRTEVSKYIKDNKTATSVESSPQVNSKLAPWGTDQLRNQLVAAKMLGKDDKAAEIEAELNRRNPGGVLDIKAKTVEKSAAPVSATGDTRYARGDAKDFDFDLSSGSLRRVGDKTYFGWTDSYGPGSKSIGEGSYGSVIRNKDGTFVKRGAISETEADLIKILGKNDIGPRLVAADINGNHPWHSENFVNIRKGRIAMSAVPGSPMGDVESFAKVSGKSVSDVYWTALAKLHRLGIAHNDAHIDNILVDDKGTGRWVDLGLAQKSPKAALAEVLGTFNGQGSDSRKGNWQTRRWDATGIKDWEGTPKTKEGGAQFKEEFPVLGKIVENRAKVFNKMRDYGITVNDYANMSDTSIRSPLSVYEQGPWAKLTNEQAQSLIDTFYDGI